jgi:signal transduction histidine kinase
MFSILLATRSAQIMQQKEPDGVSAQLEQLQELTQEALVRMRGFIAELRPKAC